MQTPTYFVVHRRSTTHLLHSSTVPYRLCTNPTRNGFFLPVPQVLDKDPEMETGSVKVSKANGWFDDVCDCRPIPRGSERLEANKLAITA